MLTLETTRAQWDERRTLAFGAISGVYAEVGTRFANNPSVMILQNFTDAAIIFTDDITLALGIIELPINGQAILDIASWGLVTAKGQGIWVKGTPSAGHVNVSVGYGTD